MSDQEHSEQIRGTTSIKASWSTPGERRVLVFELKKRGLQFREIAVALGVSENTVQKDWKRAISTFIKNSTPEAQEARALEVARLDSMRVALHSQVIKGDVMAIQTSLRISERISKLTGLDSPIQLETKSTVEEALSEDTVRKMAEAWSRGREAKA